MKIKYIFFCVFIIAIAGNACKKGDSFLDAKLNDVLNEETTFKDSTNTIAFLTRIYADVGYSFNPGRWEAGGHPVVSDEAVPVQYTGPQNDAVIMASGALSAATTNTAKNVQILNNWSTAWANIRRVNKFLSKVDESPLSVGLRTRLKAEARFLRAWYYSILLKHYAGVPIIGDKVFEPADDFNLERNTYEECVSYVVAELDAAIKDLPTNQTQVITDYGRVTKGACMGLKSRVLLYAASPLFNGGNAGSGVLKSITGYATGDQQRWKRAADAANDIITSGAYSLYEDNTTRMGYGFYKVFTMRVNNEYLFQANRALNRDFESLFLPSSRSGSYASNVTQNMVDAYGTADGLAITDPASNYNLQDPYVNRDPRFYNSVIHNGSLWFLSSTNQVVNTFFGSSPDGVGVKAQTTGYYNRKMLQESSSGNTERAWPLIRYAEILLNYAEALNEYEGPVTGVYDVLKQIRKRAGINPGSANNYGLKQNMSKEEMRLIIQNERRVELSFEEHRIWDARRWKIAEDYFNRPSRGMKITKTGTSFTYEIFDVIPHKFSNNFYLFPIPEGEISKDPKLLQNPGW
ncbi:RagB/SusD family nutrient uptake outer membrane protein [Pedobacter chinensis]|uniref:RagB/SusD family nutrient uptake outer membrane protein n=1 Tax=Pedobacter chinensis TaxID=2282421 RepID=A0A369Q091_9SPHI|nr:RagB/SusD family nutrient uptake outer membrane protein [Pedobacter chinensis]RDC58351.1 RagB/SusD family nutrient uptake outer membrane protein [Pedobacter chinensis]